MDERVDIIKDDLDDYISSRRRKYGIPDSSGNSRPQKSIMSTLFGAKKKKPAIEEQDKLTVDVDPATGRQLSRPQTAEPEEKVVKPKKKGFISSVLSKIGVSKQDVDEEFIDEYEEEMESLDEDLSETREDIKVVAKFTTDIMAKLSPKQVETIKQTPEFQKFREVLKRYELIK